MLPETWTRTFRHLPFGEVWCETGTPDKWKFTTYERDSTKSRLAYALNRLWSVLAPELFSGCPQRLAVVTPAKEPGRPCPFRSGVTV
jgi:hypothetical protein